MAAKLGVPVSTVSSWCDKGIPHWRHDQILIASRKAGYGVTEDDLLNAKVERRRRSRTGRQEAAI